MAYEKPMNCQVVSLFYTFSPNGETGQKSEKYQILPYSSSGANSLSTKRFCCSEVGAEDYIKKVKRTQLF